MRARRSCPAVQARELERGLVRLGAGVAEVHAAGLPGAGEALEARGELELRRRREVVRHVRERRRLLGDRLDEHGVRVPERVHGDAGEEVEVASPVVVPEVRALAADEHRHAGPEAAHQVARLRHPASRRLIRTSRTTSVPIPLLVKISTSTECGTRPSMIAAVSTPPSTASRHACIFGIMPDSSVGSIARSSVRGQVRDERVAVRPVGVEPGHVGEDDELRGAQRDRERRGRGIRVHVERVARVIEVGRDARDDRDAPGGELVEHRLRVDLDDVADATEVVLDAVDDDTAPAPAEQPGVLAADRPVASGPCALIFATSCGLIWPVSTMRTTEIASVLVTR